MIRYFQRPVAFKLPFRTMADYEKQFQEDLERAQALSLESLALEQFKTKKLQELSRSSTTVSVPSKPKTTSGKKFYQKRLFMTKYVIISVTRASSMNETDSQIKYDRQLSKSRPRPGTSTTSSSNSLIAPPPPSSRKNSSANDTPDLISFSNPPVSRNDIIEFCNQQRLVIFL